MKSSISKFVEMKKIVYSNLPCTGKHESYTDYDHKIAYGKLGVKVLKEIAKSWGAEAINMRHNKSGDIDRGCVGGFFKKNGKYVYVNISDSRLIGGRDILYRTAKDEKDYSGGPNHFAPVSVMGFSELGAFISENCK